MSIISFWAINIQKREFIGDKLEIGFIMFFSNNTQLEADLKAKDAEIASLKEEIELLEQKNQEAQKQARYADSEHVMNELIKSLTHGLTDGCDRDLKFIQSDLESNLNALEDIDVRNQENNEHTDASWLSS